MPKRTPLLASIILAVAVTAAAAPTPITLVICAPGYPGSTKEAQPSMDALALAVSAAAGWPPGRVAAVYHEDEASGVDRIGAQAPTVALVPLPFYLAHQRDLKLAPRLAAISRDGAETETWTLVAKKGRVAGPASLAGFTIASLAGYNPGFVRHVALGGWGTLPRDVTFVHTGQVLSSLRKAASGDNVAVLLDRAQAASLATLPFAGELEVVATSPNIPANVVCAVGISVGPIDSKRLFAGMRELHRTDAGASALDAVRLSRFVALDSKGLDSVRAAYAAGAKSSAK